MPPVRVKLVSSAKQISCSGSFAGYRQKTPQNNKSGKSTYARHSSSYLFAELSEMKAQIKINISMESIPYNLLYNNTYFNNNLHFYLHFFKYYFFLKKIVL